MHKRADRLAAISEAHHIAGWSLEEIMEEFGTVNVLMEDPLQASVRRLQPWEPWGPDLAAYIFKLQLRDLIDAAARERTLQELAVAYAQAADTIKRRCAVPVHGAAKLDKLVRAEAPDGQAWEGVIVGGEREDDGSWALDAEFMIFTTDERPEGQLVTVHGWNCDVESL